MAETSTPSTDSRAETAEADRTGTEGTGMQVGSDGNEKSEDSVETGKPEGSHGTELPEGSDTAEAVDSRTQSPQPDVDTAYPLPEDELFHVLQNERRRAVLKYLQGREGTIEMRAIAEQVAAWEHDTTVQQLNSTQRQRVYIALYQSHLEKLADAGIIEYEKSRGDVRLTDVGREVADYMSGVDDGDDGFDGGVTDYLVAAMASTVLIGGSTVGLLGSALTAYTAGILTVLLFSAVTTARLAGSLA